MASEVASLSDWEQRLSSHQPAGAVFAESEIAGLPAAVQRYFRRAIAPGTPLDPCVSLQMRGSIKLGRWLPFRACEVLNPREGFIWRARAAGVIGGSDQYVAGAGAMQWQLAGLVTVMRASGPDVSLSSAGRAAGEAIWVPTSLLPRFGVAWSIVDDSHLVAHLTTGETPSRLRITIDGTGCVTSFVLSRWGDPQQTGTWGWHPFGGSVSSYLTVDGLCIPSAGSGGWGYGEDWPAGEFFRYRITGLHRVSAPQPSQLSAGGERSSLAARTAAWVRRSRPSLARMLDT